MVRLLQIVVIVVKYMCNDNMSLVDVHITPVLGKRCKAWNNSSPAAKRALEAHSAISKHFTDQTCWKRKAAQLQRPSQRRSPLLNKRNQGGVLGEGCNIAGGTWISRIFTLCSIRWARNPWSPTNFRLMIDLAYIFWYLPLLIISVLSKAKSGQSSFVFCRKSFSQRQIDQARLQQTHGTQYPCRELDCGWLWHAYMKCSIKMYKDDVYTSLWIYEWYNIGIWLRDHMIHSVNTQTIYSTEQYLLWTILWTTYCTSCIPRHNKQYEREARLPFFPKEKRSHDSFH